MMDAQILHMLNKIVKEALVLVKKILTHKITAVD